MTELNASQTVAAFVAALNRRQLDTAMEFYESDATFVAEPGLPVVGTAAIRTALAHMLDAQPRLVTEACHVIDAGRLALYHARWSMTGTGPDGEPFSLRGESADLLRRSLDGRWRIAIDNPWGAALLQPVAEPVC